jgi:hypothetical protein
MESRAVEAALIHTYRRTDIYARHDKANYGKFVEPQFPAVRSAPTDRATVARLHRLAKSATERDGYERSTLNLFRGTQQKHRERGNGREGGCENRVKPPTAIFNAIWRRCMSMVTSAVLLCVPGKATALVDHARYRAEQIGTIWLKMASQSDPVRRIGDVSCSSTCKQ